MSAVKKIVHKVYQIWLRVRWKMGAGGASLLGEAFLSDYERKKLPAGQIWKIHAKGFTVADWCLMGVTLDNCKDFLATRDYYRLHPVNGEFNHWIDDKLTLKYLCAGTKLDRYMPKYYYQIDSRGRIMCLMDAPEVKHEPTAGDIARLLEQERTLAIKLVAGSVGTGFYKGEYRDGRYALNGEEMEQEAFCKAIEKLRDYIVIEYLQPHEELAAYCPDTVNCIRYLTGRINGRLQMLKGYIRFGTKQSGFVENYNAGGVLCYLGTDGSFTKGNIMSESGLKNQTVTIHPDSSKELRGIIPMWEEVERAVEQFDLHFPQLRYMGLDFVITSDHKVKVLEINSLTSVDGFQLDGPVYKTNAAEFYRIFRKG